MIEKETVHQTVTPYKCGKNDANYLTNIFHPVSCDDASDSKAEYPVVFFARGSNGYQAYSNGYNSWLAKVAGQGLVVVAPCVEMAKAPPRHRRDEVFPDSSVQIA